MSDLEIKINQDMIKGIVEAKIRAAVVSEFAKALSALKKARGEHE